MRAQTKAKGARDYFKLSRAGFVWRFSVLSALLLLTSDVQNSSELNQDNTAQTTMVVASYSAQPTDLLALAQKSDLVVQGLIKEIKPAIWTTPDGQPPQELAEALRDPNIQLRTPYLISIERTLKGDAADDLLFSMLGGETSQLKVVVEDERQLTLGSHIVVFLSRATETAGSWSNISPYYTQYYFVISNNALVGSQKTIAYSELEQQLRSLQDGQ